MDFTWPGTCGLLSMPRSFDLLLQLVKFRGREKLTQGDAQPVTEFLDGADGDLSPPEVQQTVYRGGRDSRQGGKLVGGKSPLFTQRLKSFNHNILDGHTDHLKEIVKNSSQVRIRTCVFFEIIIY